MAPWTVGEVAEVTDLDDDRAAALGGFPRERLDPCRVAVGVASDQHATDVVSCGDRGVHETSVDTELEAQAKRFCGAAATARMAMSTAHRDESGECPVR